MLNKKKPYRFRSFDIRDFEVRGIFQERDYRVYRGTPVLPTTYISKSLCNHTTQTTWCGFFELWLLMKRESSSIYALRARVFSLRPNFHLVTEQIFFTHWLSHSLDTQLHEVSQDAVHTNNLNLDFLLTWLSVYKLSHENWLSECPAMDPGL